MSHVLFRGLITKAQAEADRAVVVIFGRLNKRSKSRARWCVWRALKVKRGMNVNAIARHVGGLDHSSISYGLRRIEQEMQREYDVLLLARRIEDMIPGPEVRRYVPLTPSFTRYPAFPGLEDCPLQ